MTIPIIANGTKMSKALFNVGWSKSLNWRTSTSFANYSFPKYSEPREDWRSAKVLGLLGVGAAIGIHSAVSEDKDEENWLGQLLRTATEDAACCGIVGALAMPGCNKFLLEGIDLLQNRGYDSCGVCTLHDSGFLISKKASVDKDPEVDAVDCVLEVTKTVNELHPSAQSGIAHTRWATHGGKTDVNAHPHTDSQSKVALVHNGTISNYKKLKELVSAAGLALVSETDTEIIAALFGMYCNEDGSNAELAFEKVVNMLRGTWGIVAMHINRPDILLVARHGSPLIISQGRCGGILVASESSAIAKYSDKFVEIEENETLALDCQGIKQVISAKVVHPIQVDDVFLTPAPYTHWTEREIHEQPVSISNALGNGSRVRNGGFVLGGLEVHKDKLSPIKKMILTGCGTSFNACLLAAATIRKFRIFDYVICVDASEFNVDEYIVEEDGNELGVLLFSQSGETLDCTTLVKEIKRKNADVTLLSIVNVVGSSLARLTKLGVYINAGREVAVASTKAFVCQSIISCLVVGWWSEMKQQNSVKRKELLDDLVKLESQTVCIIKKLNEPALEWAKDIMHSRSMFILGKGACQAVALEGALKIKEISYIHAEGFGGGSLKHGPFALLSPQERTPVILLILDDGSKVCMVNAAEQVRARGSRLCIITDIESTELDYLTDVIWRIPKAGMLSPLLCIIPMQLLAFHLSVQKGLNPDKPRGLAKTVTVW